ncbi:PIG-P-domain-containing protein [Dothidotthia symphoricarpi CBS 119687]|uniref:PIG-P-domain-containing protein n=1 Tax=Dothidotthia symphoricarpi CBS 119687 TaxID=1392245 RepID=A0A6A6AC05_9PLEO|nr:PIG-P-domain-containing protein [Dothidotthia symphoricarpi CBS 119687]KAF2128397.1 PIG-P-domain-containing protein [Dothidotthia symphoricarpi CBS 119687]
MSRYSRGSPVPPGLQSKSTPNLPTLQSLRTPSESPAHGSNEPAAAASPRSPVSNSAPSEAASVEDNQDSDGDPFAPPDSDSGSDEDEDTLPTSRPLYTSRSYSHLPRDTATAFFPPFYGRPPTPLPPSPSLTSLLRPSFSSAATSRPTTPDSSDVDGPRTGTSTPTTNLQHMTASARHAPTVPRASPQIPTYEYYGFAVYLGSSAAFLMYILWAYVPAPLLHQMGIHYYPNRWWALAVPCWLVVLVGYIFVALASYNTKYLTLPLESCENLVDETAQVAVVERATGRIVRMLGVGEGEGLDAYRFTGGEEVEWKSFWNTGTDAVMDVPIGGVCEILYGGGSASGSED